MKTYESEVAAGRKSIAEMKASGQRSWCVHHGETPEKSHTNVCRSTCKTGWETHEQGMISILPGWWFGCHQFYFPIYWVSNHPN